MAAGEYQQTCRKPCDRGSVIYHKSGSVDHELMMPDRVGILDAFVSILILISYATPFCMRCFYHIWCGFSMVRRLSTVQIVSPMQRDFKMMETPIIFMHEIPPNLVLNRIELNQSGLAYANHVAHSMSHQSWYRLFRLHLSHSDALTSICWSHSSISRLGRQVECGQSASVSWASDGCDMECCARVFLSRFPDL